MVNQYVCLGNLRVSQCVPLIRADQGLLWGSPGLQETDKINTSSLRPVTKVIHILGVPPPFSLLPF